MNSAINPPIAYRADIDGLRAIAVTAVVAFHAFPSLFPGGFIGVDVFFVISGFLITSIILKGAESKQFKFLAFYERRLRRLLPAYVTMVIACLIAGWVLLFPKEFAEFGGSVAAASVFAANFWFLQEKSDYFANDAEFWPLLHVWSLGVEEQFYLVAPLIIIVLIALFHRAVAAAVIGLIFIVSLSASVIITPGQPDLAFFSPATRAYELAAGSILAFLPRFQFPHLWQVLFRLVGVLLILFAIFFFDEHMAFPGSLALTPCAGAALIILSGRDRDDRFSLLGSRPFVFVGLISYSWYLWHWPILAFARIHYDNIDLSAPVALGCVTVSFFVAIASWRFIERPFRNPNGPLKRRLTVYIVSAVSLSALVSAGLFISRSDGLPSRLSPEVAELLSHERYWHTDQSLHCENTPTVWSRRCTYATKTEAPELDYIILGDSHAASLATGLMPVLQERGYKGILITMPGCLPVTGPVRLTRTGGPYELCTIHNSEVFDLLAQREDAPLIILHGKWAPHAEGVDRRGPSYSSDLVWSAADGSTSRDQFDLIKDGAIAFQQSLQDSDLDVAIVGTLPAQSWHVPRQLARNLAYGAPRPDPATRDDYSPEKLGRIDNALSDHADRNETVTYHSLIDLMCETEVCLVQDEHPLYVDSHHLSFAGSRYIAQRLIEDLESQLADR